MYADNEPDDLQAPLPRPSCQNGAKEKKYSRKELDDLEAFHKYKEAFDHFDWNNTKTIATSVSKLHILDTMQSVLCSEAMMVSFG